MNQKIYDTLISITGGECNIIIELARECEVRPVKREYRELRIIAGELLKTLDERTLVTKRLMAALYAMERLKNLEDTFNDVPGWFFAREVLRNSHTLNTFKQLELRVELREILDRFC